MGEVFGHTFNSSVLTGDVAVKAGMPTVIAKYTVPAGEEVAFGQGDFPDRERAIGRIYCKLQNATPATLNGVIRLSVWSAQNRPIAIVYEARTEDLALGLTSKKDREPFKRLRGRIPEDKHLMIEFISDTDDTVVKNNSELFLDVTKFVY